MRTMTRRSAIEGASRGAVLAGTGICTMAVMGCGASIGDGGARSDYRRRGLGNLLRMGHCAPAVMRTIMEMSYIGGDALVKYAAGLPGGIGNGGYECGGVTAPVFMLGLRYGVDRGDDGLPLVISGGREYLRRFLDRHGSYYCRDIQGRGMMSCVRAVSHSPGMFFDAVSSPPRAIPEGEADAYRALWTHFAQRDFHCARSVLEGLRGAIEVTPRLLSGAGGFIGGTLFSGMTCGALTAGVMAIGAALGEIEDGRFRTLRMIALMMAGGDAMADDINKFNRTINVARRLSEWFKGEFGSTQCRDITRCDFSVVGGAESFIRGNRISRCGEIAAGVAGKVKEIILQSA